MFLYKNLYHTKWIQSYHTGAGLAKANPNHSWRKLWYCAIILCKIMQAAFRKESLYICHRAGVPRWSWA